MSIIINENDANEILDILSIERVGPWRRKGYSDQAILSIHHQAICVGAAMWPIIGLVEVALRNSVYDNLQNTFGVPGWMRNGATPFRLCDEDAQVVKVALGHAQRAMYGKMTPKQQRALDVLAFPNGVPSNISHEKHSKTRQKQIYVSDGQLIAQIPFSFWKRLFSKDYEAALWKRSLRRIFPSKTIARSDVSVSLEHLYVARNRIAHHELLYGERLQSGVAAIDFFSENFLAKRDASGGVLRPMLHPFRIVLTEEINRLDLLLKSDAV
jgi:hypothetical protein